MKHKILYAEDDETLAFLTKDNLELHGFEVVHCANGNACLENFNSGDIDICVLDIMLPGIDGFKIAEKIRKQDTEVPIIFLSAKTLKEDRIKGLRTGADDYLVKPFSIEELVLKIEIFLKRSKKKALNIALYQIGQLSFDSNNYRLTGPAGATLLTQRESELLKFFLDHRNVVLKREYILKALWGDDDYYMGRSLDVFISRLRKLLADEPSVMIENIHGIGFRMSETE